MNWTYLGFSILPLLYLKSEILYAYCPSSIYNVEILRILKDESRFSYVLVFKIIPLNKTFEMLRVQNLKLMLRKRHNSCRKNPQPNRPKVENSNSLILPDFGIAKNENQILAQ